MLVKKHSRVRLSGYTKVHTAICITYPIDEDNASLYQTLGIHRSHVLWNTTMNIKYSSETSGIMIDHVQITVQITVIC